MKIIDLLNKIANGEEVPKKIAIQNEVLIYNEDEILNLQYYYYIADEEDTTWKIWAYELNDEVEILEEKKKIPEKINEDIDYIDFNIKLFPTTSSTKFNYKEKVIINKINEIIDYLKSKGE